MRLNHPVTQTVIALLLGMSCSAYGNDNSTTTNSGSSTANQASTTPSAAEPTCGNCGTITRMEAKTKEGKGTGLGAATGAVLGAIAGRELVHGKRSNRDAAAVVGAVGGGYAGHKIEENARTSTYYMIYVEMDSDKRMEIVNVESIDDWTIGDRVSVSNGVLIRR